MTWGSAGPAGEPPPPPSTGMSRGRARKPGGGRAGAPPPAGSGHPSGDPVRDRASADRLFRSEKDREEHAVVVEDVAHVLGAFCDDLVHPHEPELLGTANVWHLATAFRGKIHDASTSVLDLVAALHPTAAVCGTPREAARATLGDLGPTDRGAYAGPLGWVDAAGGGGGGGAP